MRLLPYSRQYSTIFSKSTNHLVGSGGINVVNVYAVLSNVCQARDVKLSYKLGYFKLKADRPHPCNKSTH